MWPTYLRLPCAMALALVVPTSAVAQKLALGSLTVVEDLRIGSVDDTSASLTLVGDITVGTGGSIFVSQLREGVVRQYSEAGRYLRTLGRRGQGPGEFMAPRSMGWLKDTLWVADPTNRRLTMFDDSGLLLSTVSVMAVAQMSGGSVALLPIGMWHNGNVMAVTALTPSSDAPDEGRKRLIVKLSHTEGVDSAAPIAAVSVRNETGVIQLPQIAGRLTFQQPFSDSDLWTATAAGDAIVVLTQLGSQRPKATFRLLRISLSGDTVLSSGLEHVGIRVTDDAVDAFADQYRRYDLSDLPRRLISVIRPRDVAEAVYQPLYFPPASQIVAGRDGTVWLRGPIQQGPTTLWSVFDESFAFLGEVTLPRRLKVFEADTKYVWGVELDEVGISYVVRYRLGR